MKQDDTVRYTYMLRFASPSSAAFGLHYIWCGRHPWPAVPTIHLDTVAAAAALAMMMMMVAVAVVVVAAINLVHGIRGSTTFVRSRTITHTRSRTVQHEHCVCV